MTERLALEDLREIIKDASRLNGHSFSVLQELFALTNSLEDRDNFIARDLTIRLLDGRDYIAEQYQEMLSALLRAHGLYPYLEPQTLFADSDILAYETHRPLGMERENIVFHRVQAAIYHHLLDGQNVILSAPTSFGKSLIIDALIASGQYENLVIVVPTLALIDETRRRLARRFSAKFKIVTHPSQTYGERTIFIYTQERVVDQTDFPKIDLFVIDEFYKLDDSEDEDRTGILNQALYRLLKTGGQFYFLGPNVERISPDLPNRFNARFFQTDFSTVAIDIERVARRGTDMETLVNLCRTLNEPTLIYCKSPRQTREVARALFDGGIQVEDSRLDEAADWVAENYDPAWLVGRAMRVGIGVHNGRIPRALGQLMVRLFNAEALQFLVCTSTLIEGVNTAAKNVIIFDNKIAKRTFDFFTFNNIRGRSGRMFKHFIGHVFLFHPEPTPELPVVDIPVLSQPSTAPSSLLVQLDPSDLSEASQERLRPLLSQTDLSMDVIRESKGVSPEGQIEVAQEIRLDARSLHSLLAWRRFPRWEQLRATCNLAWNLSEFKGRYAGVSSGPQLAFKLSRLSRTPETRNFINSLAQTDRDREQVDGDEKVESALEFVRQWAGHHAPRLFLALDRIQRSVFSSLDLPSGDYSFYVGRMQGLFLPGVLGSLDEYGVPIEIGLKLRTGLAFDEGLDALLDSLRALRIETVDLTDFEKRLVLDAQESLGSAQL